jgi:predicted GTPase
MAKNRKKIIIMGAAGRDFHNFNVLYRDNVDVEVVAFTATQIPDIEGRKYPAALAGKLYPKGIPIYDEKELLDLIKKQGRLCHVGGRPVRCRRWRTDHD